MAEADAAARKLAEVIANGLRMAAQQLQDARTLQAGGSRNAPFNLFMAAEGLLLAVFASEGLPTDAGATRHQLGAMTDRLPDANPLKPRFRAVEGLTGYATTFRYVSPAGRIPAPMNAAAFAAMADRLDLLLRELAAGFEVADLGIGAREPAGRSAPIRADAAPRA